MDHSYHKLHHEAERIHNKINDLLDDKGHHLAKHLLHQAHQLTQLIKLNKRPRSLEDHIKSTISTLESIRRDGDQIMDYRHTDMFIVDYQKMQMALRKLDNY